MTTLMTMMHITLSKNRPFSHSRSPKHPTLLLRSCHPHHCSRSMLGTQHKNTSHYQYQSPTQKLASRPVQHLVTAPLSPARQESFRGAQSHMLSRRMRRLRFWCFPRRHRLRVRMDVNIRVERGYFRRKVKLRYVRFYEYTHEYNVCL